MLAAGLLERRIRIASDGEAFIILKRLDRGSLQSPVMEKHTETFFLGDKREARGCQQRCDEPCTRETDDANCRPARSISVTVFTPKTTSAF